MALQVSRGQGMVLVFLAGAIWSFNGLFIRFAGDAGTWQVLFYRSLGMVPVLALWIGLTSRRNSIRTIAAIGWAGVIGGLGLTLAFSCAIYAMQTTTIASAVFLFAAAPLITAAFSRPVLGEPVRVITWIAIAIAAVGLFVMVEPGLTAANPSTAEGWGNAAALASALGFSIFTLAVRRTRLSDMTSAILNGAVFSMIVAAVMIGWRGESFHLPPAGWGASLFLGMVIISGGMLLYTVGVRTVPASEAQLVAQVEVMLAPLWVWLFLGEQAATATLAGGSILLCAIVLNALASRSTQLS